MNKLASKTQSVVDNAYNLVNAIRKANLEAHVALVNLFKENQVDHIDILNYDDCFYMDVCDSSGVAKNTVNIAQVLYSPTYDILSVIDTEGNEWEDSDWLTNEAAVLQLAAACLTEKYNGYSKMTNGTAVRWIDPAIEDYDEEDREDVLARVFTIYNCPPSDEIENDTVITIANEETEAEVYAYELVVVE